MDKKAIKKNLPLLAQYWIEEGRQTGRFLDSKKIIKGRLCSMCVKTPFVCSGGWPYLCPDGMSAFEWFKKAEKCLNFSGG
jgi:hypothetical protein